MGGKQVTGVALLLAQLLTQRRSYPSTLLAKRVGYRQGRLKHQNFPCFRRHRFSGGLSLEASITTLCARRPPPRPWCAVGNRLSRRSGANTEPGNVHMRNHVCHLSSLLPLLAPRPPGCGREAVAAGFSEAGLKRAPWMPEISAPRKIVRKLERKPNMIRETHRSRFPYRRQQRQS